MDTLIHVGEDYLRFISSLTSQPAAALEYETAFIDCVKAFEDKALPAESKFLYGYMGLQKNTPCQIGSARSLELLEQACKEGYIPAALFLSELYQKSRDLVAPDQERDYYYQLLAGPIVKGHPHALYLRAKFLGEEWAQAPVNSLQKESLGLQAHIAKKFIEDMGYCGSDLLSHVWGSGGGPGEQFTKGHEELLRRVIKMTVAKDIFMKNIIVDSQFRLGVMLYKEYVDYRKVEGLGFIRSAASVGHDGAMTWLQEQGFIDDEPEQTDAGPMSYFKKPPSAEKTNDDKLSEEMELLLQDTMDKIGEDIDENDAADDASDIDQALIKKEVKPDSDDKWWKRPKKNFKIHKPEPMIFLNGAYTTEQILQPLDAFVGMDEIKEQIKDIVEYGFALKLRKKAGLNTRALNLHCIFSGAPGTGKTTVARALGTVLYRAGILRTGQVVEVASEDLIGTYVGDTIDNTMEACKAAEGGILFIDEAYGVSEVYYYGEEFVNTMVKVMEDQASDLMVIAAGYTTPMNQFMQSNPGFRSRFSKTLHFQDFTLAQLVPVFMKLCEKYDYTVSPFAMKRLDVAIAAMKKKEGPRFGNARSVRNMFDDIVRRQGQRIVRQRLREKDDLMVITAGDISSSDDHGGDDVVMLADRKRKS